MARLRLALLLAIIIVSSGVNLVRGPHLYIPREPVFNGVDIASTWEWRSMAYRDLNWWLAFHFPGTKVSNVGYLAPPDKTNSRPNGIEFSNWRDEYLPLDLDQTSPPLELSSPAARKALLDYGKVFSRIECRDNQIMLKEDSCYFFIAWDDTLITSNNLIFYGVRTNLDKDSEYALVESKLLARVTAKSPEEIPTIWESDY